ncbi:MAG TPA: response regulator [Rubrivivax sp.]|nr:response regulator [Rubrivivax sp.]HPO19461.1 response regulator [Rubrivivax sp.]
MASPSHSVSVVDDDAEVRAALARLVTSAGYQARAYSSGDEFLRDVESHRPHCVVLDLQMPGASGLDVLQALAQRRIGVPVVTITGYDSDKARATARQLGARDYLCKPVDGESLLAAIASVVD